MTDTTTGPMIEDLFYQGHPLDHVIAAGDEVGWTKDDVLAVLREHAWDLDGSGRLPRSKRITTPRGLRHPAPPPPAKSTTSTTSRHRTLVPDPLDGHPLPTEPPTPAEAMAEQSALDVPVGNPSATVAALSVGKLTAGSLSADVTVPDGERWLPPLDDARLPEMAGSITVASPAELAREIRARVDEIAPRANPDGSVNASHVAMEQTLRERAGLAGYFSELDGPGNFLPDGDADPVSDPPPSPDPVTAPEPRTPIDPAQPRRRPRPQPPLAQRGRQLPGLDLDDWLHEASRSPDKTVQLRAGRCILLHEQLHDALDDLVRAEHAHAREQA